MKTKGMSLKYKILTALTLSPFIGMSLYLLLAVTIFQQDKIAYIFDSSLAVSKTKAARTRGEVLGWAGVLQSIVYGYQANTKTMAASGEYYFKQESRLKRLEIYALSSTTGQFEKTLVLDKNKIAEPVANATLKERNLVTDDTKIDDIKDSEIKDMIQLVQNQALHLGKLKGSGHEVSQNLSMLLRFGELDDPKRLVVRAVLDGSELSEAFRLDGGVTSFLLQKGQSLLGEDITLDNNNNWSGGAIWSKLGDRKTPEGIAEIDSPDQQHYLASFVSVGLGDLQVLSVVPKSQALSAVQALLKKSILFFTVLLALIMMFSVWISRRLTAALHRLAFATEKISQGDFNVHVDLKARDEIGLLADGFNRMAVEVSRLMSETADKARMEAELVTARTVQETLFPENHAQFPGIELSGYYQPASECGGDWWYYFKNDTQIYVCIGDATGHGAPAALITSAARAVASVIQSGPSLSPSVALALMNRAIFDASKGRMMMTFFLGVLNTETGEFVYSNASHEAPLLLKKMDKKPARKDYIPLNEVNNPRLGESGEVTFKETSVQLDPGDRIVLYTDGVTDIKDTSKKAWGERQFIKALSEQFALNEDQISDSLKGFVDRAEEYRSQTALDDDVTLIFLKFNHKVSKTLSGNSSFAQSSVVEQLDQVSVVFDDSDKLAA